MTEPEAPTSPTCRKLVRREFKSDSKPFVAFFVYCPACVRAHRFITENGADPREVWHFDGNLEYPTFSPSLQVESGPLKPGGRDEICHSYLTCGVWDFRPDSTHAMAGQKVPMIAFPENYRV